MKILYFTSSYEDYLQDQILIGLRKVYGENVIDYPKKDVLYDNCEKANQHLYGNGFTIWKNLPDIEIDRFDIFEKIKSNEFDIIVFGSIWRQKQKYMRFLKENFFNRYCPKPILLDGEDHTRIFPPGVFYGTYFKREQNSLINFPFVNKINFSIPQEKIRVQALPKNKLFAKHVQCKEAYKLTVIRENCQESYVFSEESVYYEDIARSKYAITMKKAGWDCMRHYEIAANQTVPCFYKLHEKPKNCAPHGLIDMYNVLAFSTAGELEDKLEYIEKSDLYPQLQENATTWVKRNSCEKIAYDLIKKTSRSIFGQQ